MLKYSLDQAQNGTPPDDFPFEQAHCLHWSRNQLTVTLTKADYYQINEGMIHERL